MFQACEKNNNTQSPTCIITNPVNDQQIPKGDIVPIIVEAADTDGSIAEVNIFIDAEKLGSQALPPYNISWNTSNESLGNKIIKAVSIDNNNNQKTDEITVVIFEDGDKPEAAFSVDVTSGIAPLTVQFSDESNNEQSVWQWDFGDGNTSSDQHPTHIYNVPNIYSVALTASNDFGSDVISMSNFISVIDENTFIDPRDDQVIKLLK